jgi:thiamine biosynthesis lipoprotein
MRRLLSLILCLLCLAGCGRVSVQEQQAYVFGTRVEVLVVSDDPAHGRQAIASVLREFDRLHRAYHAWQDSELTALNQATFQGRPQQVSEELANLIRESQELAQRGHHLFDPGIGQLVKVWGFHADEFKAHLAPGERNSANPSGPSINC